MEHETLESIYSEIKVSLKDIIHKTNSILEDSEQIFKKAKVDIVQYEPIILKPKGLLKEWFVENGLNPLSSTDFFDYLFSKAASTGRLNSETKHISFSETEAKIFGHTSMHIYDLFEQIPTYFE